LWRLDLKLYKFYKEGCSPCGTLVRFLNQIDLETYHLQVEEVNMSLAENKTLYPEINIVPTLRLENGVELVGLKLKRVIIAWLDENIGNGE
jgi:hypothetical protein